MSVTRCVLFFALTVSAVACGGAATSTPRIRVARDLGCTPEQTSVQRVSEYDWEVRGCGKIATYRCTYPVRDCWREGEIRAEARSEAVEPQSSPPPVVSGR